MILLVVSGVVAAAAFDLTTAMATAAVVGGIGAAVLGFFKVGPERRNIIVTYQAQVLDDLHDENKRLVAEKLALLDEKADALERIDALEERIRIEQRRCADLEAAMAALQRERAADQRRLSEIERKATEAEARLNQIENGEG